jgi:deoxycytidylate deaminase
MYIDAANRKIKEPIDYLIEAKKKYKKLGAVLTLAECPELAREADILNAKINRVLSEKPIEEWETVRRSEPSNQRG